MIVYNVKRRWFPMKNDAEAYRRSEGLPVTATYTLRIDDRDQLAALLNALCGYAPETIETPEEQPEAEQAAPVSVEKLSELEMIKRNILIIPDGIPEFLLKDFTHTKLVRAA